MDPGPGHAKVPGPPKVPVPWARAQGPSELVNKDLYARFCSYTILIKSNYLEKMFDAVIVATLINVLVYIWSRISFYISRGIFENC